jgi:glycosyltransferase involved in cell wall biosynthesis
MGPTLGSIIYSARDRSLRLADAVVAIGERMAAHVSSSVRSPARLEVIHNWADGEAIRPIPHEANALRRIWGVEKSFVVGYSGNLGRVHEFDTMLDAAAAMRDDDRVRFLIVGRGPRLAEVQAGAARRRLANMIFKPHQDRAAPR